MADAWIYVDESQAPSEAGAEAGMPFRIGALLVEAPIAPELTDAALATLAADPDAAENKFDQETLRRGFFHASIDSANAHSALTYAITAGALKGAFTDTQWHFGRTDSSEHEGSELHALLVSLGALTITLDDYDTVHLIVAGRAGSFESQQVASWHVEWTRQCLSAFAEQPDVPMRFPRMTLTLAEGGHPGVQVCDLLLWAVQRARLEKFQPTGKKEWMNRLGLSAWVAMGAAESAHHETTLTLGKGVDRFFAPPLTGGTPRDLDGLDASDLLALLREIEAIVIDTATLGPAHPRVGHLHDELVAASEVLGTRAGTEDLVRVASAFLKVCDTLPTYDPTDAAAYVRVLERRRVAAGIVDRRQLRWFTMAKFWSKSR